LVEVNENELTLLEDMNTNIRKDTARITVKLSNPSVLFKHLDKHTVGLFKRKQCADFAICELISIGSSYKWKLHLFEFKRTIKEKLWYSNELLKQFEGAYINILAHVSFLEPLIPIDEVTLYTCYKNDKLSGDETDPVSLRHALHNPSDKRNLAIMQWQKKMHTLHTTFNDLDCKSIKIKVGEDFKAVYSL
jgi:hypothetical protein